MRNTRQTCRNSANVPHFMAKSAAIQGFWHFTRQRTAARPSKCGAAIKVWRGHQSVARPSKCGAHGGRKAAHMTPRFQVPRWCICCILFDVNCMWVGIHQCAFVRSSLLFSLSLLPLSSPSSPPLPTLFLCLLSLFSPSFTNVSFPPSSSSPPLSLSLSLSTGSNPKGSQG